MAFVDEGGVLTSILIGERFLLSIGDIVARTVNMLSIRFHGRGGQGAVTSSEMLALAAIAEGKFSQAFPSFGPERRGAPVVAFARVSEERILMRSQIYKPDVVVVLDASLLAIANPTAGLKPGGEFIVNTGKDFSEIRSMVEGEDYRITKVDANAIAREELGRPITNTTMLGAMIRATGIVDLKSIDAPFIKRFGERLAERNIKAFRRSYEEALLEER